MKTLKNKIALVTGASRGIGKGIAKGLAEKGATVYITGRTTDEDNKDAKLSGTINQTAKKVNELGGIGIPYKCDHRNDEEVEALFKKIEKEQGKLDILVNNVWAGYENIYNVKKPEDYIFENNFWELPNKIWDDMFDIGLRSHFVASKLAVPLMLKNKQGLIVNISFYAGQTYISNVPYGVVKSAVDRLSVDMAYELKEYGITSISLYPGLVRTEGVMRNKDFIDLSNSGSPLFIGRAVAALAEDKKVIEKSGQVLIAAELAEEYNFTDIDGTQPRSLRDIYLDT
ncbi:MAG TPA: SDR family NAD(P)-dependent oxidoreductase [Halanaerobiales bacterium]|nr:SDR family NAD(P)-dependent oxidoreductase [Halanaerobiales bacterium]